jgi:hypothetical protein
MLSLAPQLVLRFTEATSNPVLAGVAGWAQTKGGFKIPRQIGAAETADPTAARMALLAKPSLIPVLFDTIFSIHFPGSRGTT